MTNFARCRPTLAFFFMGICAFLFNLSTHGGIISATYTSSSFLSDGQSVAARIEIDFDGNPGGLGIYIPIPAGWQYKSFTSSSAPLFSPEFDSSSPIGPALSVVWNDDSFLSPVTFQYTIEQIAGTVPVAQKEGLNLSGSYDLPFSFGDPLHSLPALLIEPPPPTHSADYNKDWSLSAAEVLRVINMKKFGPQYHAVPVDSTNPDGYTPGAQSH